MKYNHDAAKLLQYAPNALRVLHDVRNYDFEKPYFIQYHKGAYTVNKVLKTISEQFANPAHCQITLLTRDTSRHFADLNIVAVFSTGDISVDINLPWYGHKRNYIGHFFTKSSFTDVRKSEDAETYFIAQCSDDLTKSKKYIPNLSERFRHIPGDHGMMCDNRGNHWVYRVNLQSLSTKGEKFEHKFDYHNPATRSADISDYIDKSGYIIRYHREELKRRAAALRAEREKAVYLQHDYTNEVEELELKVTAAKNKMINLLINAATGSEVGDIAHKIPWVLSSAMRALERFKEKSEARTFASIADSKRAYNAVLSELDRLEV